MYDWIGFVTERPHFTLHRARGDVCKHGDQLTSSEMLHFVIRVCMNNAQTQKCYVHIIKKRKRARWKEGSLKIMLDCFISAEPFLLKTCSQLEPDSCFDLHRPQQTLKVAT